jgi:hypothetical protein
MKKAPFFDKIGPCNDALKQVCDELGYDYVKIEEGLIRRGHFWWKESDPQQKLHDPLEIKVAEIPGLCWKSKPECAERIFESILVQTRICKCTSRFLELFKQPKKCLQLELDYTRASYVLQFIAFLKDSGFFYSCHCNSIYAVFQYHVIGFNEVFLRNQPPRKRVDTVKKHKDWPAVEEDFQNMFRYLFISTQIEQDRRKSSQGRHSAASSLLQNN